MDWAEDLYLYYMWKWNVPPNRSVNPLFTENIGSTTNVVNGSFRV